MSGKTKFRTHAIKGGVFTSAAQISKFFLQIVSISVLARLLRPEDFGLVASVAAAVTVLSLFRELGLTSAIIQKPEISQEDLSRLFRVTVLIGLTLLGISVLLGIAVAWFLKQPLLMRIAPCYGAAALLSSLEVIPLGLLRRRLEFGRIAARDIVAAFFGIGVGILLAFLGAGYWALVASPFCIQAANTTLSWMAAGWRPDRNPSDWKSALPYLGFGGTITLGGLSSYVCQNLDRLLIGKIWGFSILGYYTRATALVVAPVNQVSVPLNSVLLPVLSRMAAEPDRRRRWVEALFSGALVVAGVGAAWIMACSQDIVAVLLGDGWDRVASVIWWLTPVILLRPAGSVLYSLIVSSGKVKTLLSWTWIGSVLTIVGILVGIRFGLEAVAGAMAVTTLLRMLLAIHFCARERLIGFLGMSVRCLAGVAHFVVCGAALSALVVWAETQGWPPMVRMLAAGVLAISVVVAWVFASDVWRRMAMDFLGRAIGFVKARA